MTLAGARAIAPSAPAKGFLPLSRPPSRSSRSTGPTASGKSALAIALAEKLAGEVVACDSTQVYRGFDIGTAKPSAAERRGIPHHLMDIVSPAEIFTAGEYRNRALEVLADLRRRRRLPIFTVGTGLYFRALTEGLADAPARSDRLRARLNAIQARRGAAPLHRILRRLDPSRRRRASPRTTVRSSCAPWKCACWPASL